MIYMSRPAVPWDTPRNHSDFDDRFSPTGIVRRDMSRLSCRITAKCRVAPAILWQSRAG